MRITTSVVMFYLWVSASASVLEVTGVAESMGVSTTMSVGDGLDRSVQGLSQIQGGGISAESVVGLYTIAYGAIETFVSGLTAGPRIMIALGIPVEFVVFLTAPIPLLAGRMIVYGLSGRDL